MRNTICQLFFLAVLSLSLCACDDAPAKTAVDAHAGRDALDWSGTYKGVIPCADCEGIEETINLEQDGNYNKTSRYLGKVANVWGEKGSFEWDKSGQMIALEKSENKYQVGENKLIMLDMSGQKITGPLADHYILNKQSDAPLKETYWKLIELMGKPVTPSRNEAHVILKEKDSRVIGSGGCNRMTGGYAIQDSNRIQFTQMATTRMACPDGMERENEFLEVLGKADSYILKDGRLQLLRARMAPLAVFEPVYLR